MQRVGFIRGIYVWGVISNRGVCHSMLSGARGILKNAELEQVGHILNHTVKRGGGFFRRVCVSVVPTKANRKRLKHTCISA